MVSGTLGVFAELDSPIAWRSFETPTLERAEADGRLLFLVIGVSWCPYSQRLLRRLAHDVETQAVLHESYLPILVDGDDHPAIHTRYSGGGWPSIAICTSDGLPIWRGTQVDPGGFPRLLRTLADRPALATPATSPIELDAPSPDAAANQILRAVRDAYDPASRGFALEPEAAGPRFPHFDAIELLLEIGTDGDTTMALDALRQIMDRLWHRADGGLRRYATAPNWSDVHGEKLLVDQASLIATLAAARVQDPECGELASAVLEWTIEQFRQTDGAFAAGLRPAHVEVPPAWPVPALDTSILIDWNARLASALLLLAEATADREQHDRAVELVRSLLAHVADGHVPHRVRGGVARAGTLADLTYLAVAAFDAGMGEVSRGLVDRALADRRLPDGSLSDIPLDDTAPGLLRRPIAPLRENAVFAELCARLGGGYWETGREILEAVSGSAIRGGIMASRYAVAQLRTAGLDSD